jgi:hypothetical protein
MNPELRLAVAVNAALAVLIVMLLGGLYTREVKLSELTEALTERDRGYEIYQQVRETMHLDQWCYIGIEEGWIAPREAP